MSSHTTANTPCFTPVIPKWESYMAASVSSGHLFKKIWEPFPHLIESESLEMTICVLNCSRWFWVRVELEINSHTILTSKMLHYLIKNEFKREKGK